MTAVTVYEVEEKLAMELARAGASAVASRHRRDALIVEAHKAGGGVREIARLVGLSHPAVLKIIEKARLVEDDATTTS